MLSRSKLLSCAALLMLGATAGATHHRDRRIVDRVIVGDDTSEQSHAYAGDSVTIGSASGRAFRKTRAWMRYALTVFDDTEVTVACTFVGEPNVVQTFDLFVDNQFVTTYTFRPTSMSASVVEMRVPIKITRGRANILVMLYAKNGSTPGLLELRTVQDHNE